ncbi:MAG: protein translocase subunit SecDF [Bacteroidales bacterium]|nr:protein translocase subunit SecDF [Bacteroidales bacterium]
MQNKGAIKVIAVIFALICLYQLSFTYFTKRVESNAREFATNQTAVNEAKKLSDGDQLRYQEIFDSISSTRENAYLDSVSEQPVYNFLFMRKFTYRECKAREINLGLDLKGGMNVMMEVSTVDVIKNLASNPSDPVLVSLIDQATKIHREQGGKYIDCFEKAVNAADAKQRVSLSSFFRVKLQEKGITANSTNQQVLSAIRNECSDSYERTFQVLSKRIDKFGVAQPTIQKLQATERIAIELPGIKDPQRVANLLEGSAQLQFWLVEKDLNKAYKALQDADSWLASVNSGRAEVSGMESSTESLSETASENIAKNDTLSAEQKSHPLLSLFSSMGNPQITLAVGTASSANKAEITRLLKDCKVLPKDLLFLWSAKPLNKTNQYELYAIHLDKNKTPLLDGDVISDAKDDFDQQGRPVVSMVMKSEAASKWAKITANHKGECIAIVLDSAVYSAPRVNSEITGGRSEISGSFTVDETKDLSNILKSGKLTAPAIIVQESVVGPSLGEESIKAGMISFLFAFLLVLVYMIFFYSTAGIAACVALICNLFFLFGVLASLGAVLTLPGIAGIVLTMGMAVDANVIINERVKEELLKGKNIASAIADGYKVAYSAIIDGNVTTLLTGIVLAYFGSGPVQGFAITLCIGILTSLFCGIFISRLVFEALLNRKGEKKANIAFYNKMTQHFLENPKVNFVGTHKKQLIVVALLGVIAIGSLAIKGLDFGVDFAGGRTYVIRFDQDVTPEAVKTSLTKEFGSAPEVKTYGPAYQVKVTTDYKVKEDNEQVKREVISKLFNGTKSLFKDNTITEKKFQSTETSPLGIISSEIVGPTMAEDIQRSAIIAVIISLVLIFIYIAIRFNKWQYGLAGLASLSFDALITIGAFSLFNKILPFTLEVDQQFVAVVLTVIGYSINDTVIVFDRVRENVKLFPKEDYGKLMNDAMNQTLSRTFNTLGTTLLTLLIIFIFGGEGLRGFSFSMLIGIATGCFASLCVACPTAYYLITRKQAKATEAKK